MVRMITAAAVFTIAGSAMAVPTDAHWEMVDNSTNNAGTDTGFENSWMTFDLFVDFEAGDQVSAVDFGIAGGNIGISTDGAYFDGAPFSGDDVSGNLTFSVLAGDLEYDTAVTMGGNPVSFAQALLNDGTTLTGAWFTNPATLANGSLWVARITVNNDAGFLGGEVFVSGSGPNGPFGQQVPSTGIVAVPNAKIPTPSAIAIFCLAGTIATRRRR